MESTDDDEISSDVINKRVETSAGDTVIVATLDGNIYGIDEQTGEKKWTILIII